MSHSNTIFVTPSSEFVSLARAQIAVLTQALKADWSAVYLTGGIDKAETTLIPVVVYPQTDINWQEETRLTLPPQGWNQEDFTPQTLTQLTQAPVPDEADKAQPQQTTPLVHSTIFPTTETVPSTTVLSETSKPSNPSSLWVDAALKEQHQIVLPLVYEERMMGLLVTGRQDRVWNSEELAQIEKIARTLAIARLLDQRQNLSQRQLNEQQLRQRLERDRLDDLLHQLRNPLTALRTFAKLLLKRLLPGDPSQSVVKGILRESDRLQELLQEFETETNAAIAETPTLTISSTPPSLPEVTSASSLLLPGHLPLELVKTRDVLEPLLVSLSAIAQEKKLELTANLPDHLPPVQGNKKALREVLNNLIDNAIKYTPSGGKVEIEVRTKKSTLTGDCQGIVIRDTGYGIPLEEQEHIFERHYRGVQEQGNIPGSGLGLAIVKDLVEQMQGKIDLISPNLRNQSTALPGTTFIVWLPTQES